MPPQSETAGLNRDGWLKPLAMQDELWRTEDQSKYRWRRENKGIRDVSLLTYPSAKRGRAPQGREHDPRAAVACYHSESGLLDQWEAEIDEVANDSDGAKEWLRETALRAAGAYAGSSAGQGYSWHTCDSCSAVG